jgi:hypothetical protein
MGYSIRDYGVLECCYGGKWQFGNSEILWVIRDYGLGELGVHLVKKFTFKVLCQYYVSLCALLMWFEVLFLYMATHWV